MRTNVSIHVFKGDITSMETDAIVNAANRSLLGGGGVDGAIHHAAGPELMEECRMLNGCETGKAKITKGYRLKAKYVIHTVGPIWNDGEKSEARLLEDCYTNCLLIAEQYQLKSVAFPNISTGVYKFPKEYAAKIAHKAVFAKLDSLQYLKDVYFVCFDDENYQIYKDLFKQIN